MPIYEYSCVPCRHTFETLVREADIASAMRLLYDLQGLLVEPSSAVPIAVVKEHEKELQEPLCIILTGENITREDFFRLIAREPA